MPGWKPRLFFFRHWHWCHRIPVHQGHQRANTSFPHTCYPNVWLYMARYTHSSHTRRSAGLVTEPRSLAWKSNDLPRDHREPSNCRLCVGVLKIQSYMFTWFCRNMVYIPMHYIRLWKVSLLMSCGDKCQIRAWYSEGICWKRENKGMGEPPSLNRLWQYVVIVWVSSIIPGRRYINDRICNHLGINWFITWWCSNSMFSCLMKISIFFKNYQSLHVNFSERFLMVLCLTNFKMPMISMLKHNFQCPPGNQTLFVIRPQ